MTTAANLPTPPSGQALDSKIDPAVVQSIRQASRATHVDFGYLMAQAAQESGFNSDAKAAGSSATGLFQFIDSTWLQMVQQHGAQHGLGQYAQQITNDASGRPVVADPATRATILNLRKDPAISAVLAAEYAKSNKDEVERAIGRPARSADLYLAHFLGAGGASELLKAVATNASTPAAELLPDAAAANTRSSSISNRARRAASRRSIAASPTGSRAMPPPTRRSIPARSRRRASGPAARPGFAAFLGRGPAASDPWGVHCSADRSARSSMR
jgi:hypothetical protein